MNRIYQGRVSSALLIEAKGAEITPPDWNWESALWDHHALFQDAVNYYVVCLLALATEKDNPLHPIREKLDAHDEVGNPDELMVWRPFRRRGVVRRGLRDSVAPFLCPGQPDATPEDCFAAVLKGSDTTGELRDLALAELLFVCEGDNPIKTQGRWMFDRFCNPAYSGGFPFDAAKALREVGESRLKKELHSLNTQTEMEAFASQLRLAWVVTETKEAAPFGGEAARTRLLKAIAHFRQGFGEKADTELGERAAAFLSQRSDADEALQSLAQRIRKAPTDSLQTIPRNNRSIADRLEAAILFKFFPNSFTADLLKVSFPAAPAKVKATRKKPELEDPAVRFTQFGGDAIEMARGRRGYVFRAFTALNHWNGDDTAKPTWLLFDVLAFKEALKALHQVEAKKEERDDERAGKIARLEYQRQCTFHREPTLDLGKSAPGRRAWKGDGESEEGFRPPVLTGDPRIARLEQLVDEELRDEYEMSEGVSVKYGLQQRTIRGFRDVREKWNDALKPSESFSEAAREKLWNLLTDYKKENAETIGSPVLFDAMVEEKNWIIWREPTAEQMRQWRAAAKLPDDTEFATDPLQALTDERELIEEIERLGGPIRFTPADPEHSRRQFYFSDVTNLEASNRLRHDRQTVDAEIAVKGQDGKWQKTDLRMHFSAPRLLRDQLNNTGGKDAAFQQAMMTALGLSAGLKKTEKGKVREARFEECAAVALMPEITSDGEKRILLNFPIRLEDDAVARQLGKAARWDALQFGGADKDSFWLRWPKTWIDEKKERKKAPPTPWWKSAEPFRCLSVDLGQRDAGAFALIAATPDNPPKPGSSRKLGVAENRTWWATVRATGLLRLPGEDAEVRRARTPLDDDQKTDFAKREELSGERGRNMVGGEWRETCGICEQLGLNPRALLGDEPKRYSFPEANDRLLFLLRRAQARLARLQSWSCVGWQEPEAGRRERFEKRRQRIKDQIRETIDEASAKADQETPFETPDRRALLTELKPLVAKEAWDVVGQRLKAEVEKERLRFSGN